MKITLLFVIHTIALNSFAQTDFPDFLRGTWEVENKNLYEHWDGLNEYSLKGLAYTLDNGQLNVSEYLDITKTGEEVVYTATVLNQNGGKGVPFVLSLDEGDYTFKNLNHSFPKVILYRKLSNTEVFVEVSDGKGKGFSYTMKKIL